MIRVNELVVVKGIEVDGIESNSIIVHACRWKKESFKKECVKEMKDFE